MHQTETSTHTRTKINMRLNNTTKKKEENRVAWTNESVGQTDWDKLNMKPAG